MTTDEIMEKLKEPSRAKKVYYVFYRFWDKYNPVQLFREAKYKKQRMQRGW